MRKLIWMMLVIDLYGLFVFQPIQLSFQNKSVLKWIFYIFYYNQLYIIQNEIS